MKSTAGATKSRATGPRSITGKRRSRMNAIKYGIHSQHFILEGENLAEFDKLRRDFKKDRQPQGPIEEELVEHLRILILAAATIPSIRSREYLAVAQPRTSEQQIESRFGESAVVASIHERRFGASEFDRDSCAASNRKIV